MRPYTTQRHLLSTRSDMHGGRPFPNKRIVRRRIKKSARQLARAVVRAELDALRAEEQRQRKLDEEQDKLEAQRRALDLALSDECFDAMYDWDSDWDSECPCCVGRRDEDAEEEYREMEEWAYDEQAREEHYWLCESVAYDDLTYDWGEDPDFTERQVEKGVLVPFDIEAWRRRKL